MKFWKYVSEFFLLRWLFGVLGHSKNKHDAADSFRYADDDDGRWNEEGYQSYDDFLEEQEDYDMMDDF